MYKFLLSFLFCFLGLCSSVSFSQEITVTDEVTLEHIPGVKIYSKNPKVQLVANSEGRFRADAFKGCDSIFVSYPEYRTLVFSYLELSKLTGIQLSESHLVVSEMAVSASRWEQDKAKSPTRITKLHLKDIALLEPQTTADLLEASGYVFIQKSQFAGGSPQLRGFGANRIMIVVDGVRMNNAIFRSGNLQNIISLDPNSLESVEIQFGPGSVLYGSDAIGGVMNFTTKMPIFSPDTSKTLTKTTVFTRYSSASNESTSHLSFNLGKKSWSTVTDVSFSRFGDLKTGKYGNNYFLRPTYQTSINGVDTTLVNDDPRRQINSGYSQFNILHKAHFKLNEDWLIGYDFNYSNSSNAPRYDRLTLDKDEDGKLDNAEWYYGPQEWMMHRFSLLNKPSKKRFYNQFRVNLAYQKYNESRNDRKTGSNLTRRQFEEVNAFSLNIDFKKEWTKTTGLVYGLEGVINQVNSNAYKEEINSSLQTAVNSRYPDGSIWQTYGAYLNLKHSFSEKWTVTTGIRYSIYDIRVDFDTSLFAYPVTSLKNSNGALNGSAGIAFNPSSRTQLYFNASTGYRAPNIDDIGKVFDSEPGSVIVPNVNLKPEFAYNFELGFVKAIKSILKIDGATYFTYLKDALARSSFLFNGQDSIMYEGSLSRVMAIQNSSNAYVFGAQGGIEFVLGKGFSVKSSISYQKGFEYRVDSVAYFPKSHVAPIFGRTSFILKRKHLHLEAYIVYQGRMKPEDLPLQERNDLVYAQDVNGDRFTPSWYTINFKGAYFFNKHLSLNAGVENITNQLYRTFGSGISSPGINFTVSIKVVF